MAPLIKSSLYKHGDLSSVLRVCGKKVGHSVICMQSQLWGSRDKLVPGTHWPTRLAYLVRFRQEGDPVSQKWVDSTWVAVVEVVL